jgi:hypothetical protein
MNRLDKSALAASESAVLSSSADHDLDQDWPLDSADELQSCSLDAPSVPEVVESLAHSSNDVVKIRSGDGHVFYIPVSIASVSTVLAGMLVPGSSNIELLISDADSTILYLNFLLQQGSKKPNPSFDYDIWYCVAN